MSDIRKKKSGTKDAKDDATIHDVRYVAANTEYLTKLQNYEAILAREEAARRDCKTLSRLLEKEKLSLDNNRREHNMGNSGFSKRRRGVFK